MPSTPKRESIRCTDRVFRRRRHSTPPLLVVVGFVQLMMVGLLTLRHNGFLLVRGWSRPYTGVTKRARMLQTRPMRIASSSTATTATTSREAATTISTDSNPPSRILLDETNNGVLSVNLRTVADHLDVVQSHLESRYASEATHAAAARIAQAAQERSDLIQQRDAALQRRKEQSGYVGKYMMQKAAKKQSDDDSDDGEDLESAIAAAKQASQVAAAEAEQAETALAKLQTEMDDCLDSLPNMLDNRVPEGKDESKNEVVSVWGDPETTPVMAKAAWVENSEAIPLWHDDVATQLGGYAAESAVQMSGARFVALTGVVARLERALGMWLMDLHTSPPHNYTEAAVPYIVGRSALYGTSQLPKFQDDLFAIAAPHTCNGQDAFLIPTAEVPLTNLHAGGGDGTGGILDESQLPLSYVAWTPCFRAEAGSYGRDTRGLIRTHQFAKVELVKITTSDQSDAEHELLTSHAERCLQLLELPYRKVRLCAGDIGFAARHCYDLEVWLPGAQEYREISSCSNTGDFQARRMGLRYRPSAEKGGTSVGDGNNNPKQNTKKKQPKQKKKPKPQLCHTINGSGLAVGRTLVAVLENYQQPDGSVLVPKVLQPYMGGKEVLLPVNRE